MPDETGNAAKRIVWGAVAAVLAGLATTVLIRVSRALPPLGGFLTTILTGAAIAYLVVFLLVRRAVDRAAEIARNSGNEIIQEVMMEDVKKTRRDLRYEPWKSAAIGAPLAAAVSYLLGISVFV